MFWAALLLAFAPVPPQDGVAERVNQLVELADEADSAAYEALAAIGTREAAEGLVRVLDELGSVAMRQDAVLALAQFDGVPEAEETALTAIANVATTTESPELYMTAVDALGDCPSLGKHYLRQIVGSPASQAVRVRAMVRHVEHAEEADHEWYEEVLEGPRKKQAYKDDEAAAVGKPLTRLRELALEAIAPTMRSNELVDLAKEFRREQTDPQLDGIRRRALAELARREHSQAVSIASSTLSSTREPSRNRAAAARILFELRGDRMASDFVEAGLQHSSVMPTELRATLAELVREMQSSSAEKKLLSSLRKEEREEAIFCIQALGASQSPKFPKLLLERLEDPASDVRVATVRAFALLGDPEYAPPIQALMDREHNVTVVQACMEALSVLSPDPATWRAQLVELAGGSVDQIRNAALMQLAGFEGEDVEGLMAVAFEHEQWSTRLVALDYYEAQHSRAATGRIIARMASEEGFVLNRFAEALWRLTGEPHRKDAARWARWWKDYGADFEPLTPEQLAERDATEQRRRLSQRTTAKTFFGVQLETKRMVFIIDVSGSMDELLHPRPGVETAESRMAVARRELSKFLGSLDDGTLFNVIVFSTEAARWKPEGAASSTPSTRAEAQAFVQELRAFGATNLFGALKLAFDDLDIDTIIVLSDGEPSAGEEVDPYMIRRRVAEWNEGRGSVVHAISVGGSLAILSDLAADTGGTYVEFE